MAAFAGGLAALVLGFVGLIFWWWDFLVLLRGGLPIMLILGGALAAYLGFEEIKDKRSEDSITDTSPDLKGEVESLKEEIKGLKEEKKEPEENKTDSE